MAVQSYVRRSAASAASAAGCSDAWRWPSLPRVQAPPRQLLVLLLVFGIATSLVWSLDRQADLQDLGSFLHSGASYNAGLNPYEYHFALQPQPISNDALNLNPPVSVYVFAAMTGVPQELLSRGVLLGSVLLFGVALFLLLREYPEKREPLVILAICSLAGVWHTLGYLQIYVPLILSVIAAWMLLRRGNPLLAGVAIGLVVAVKPNFVLWPVLLLAAGHSRVSISALSTAVGISAIPLLVDGPGIYRQWLEVTSSFGGLEWASNASLISIGGRFGLQQVSYVLGMAIVAAMLAWLWREKPDVLSASSLSILAVILVSPISWAGYTLFLLPYLFSRPWNKQVWLSVLMLAMPFWMVRELTLMGSVANALFGPMYGWAVLLLFVVTVREQLTQAPPSTKVQPAVAA